MSKTIREERETRIEEGDGRIHRDRQGKCLEKRGYGWVKVLCVYMEECTCVLKLDG